MKARRVWRYTCDFCRKSGMRKDAIAAHEARCFCNPARKCTMCEDMQEPLAELMALFEGAEQETVQTFVDKVETAAHGCPACTVAAIRQTPHLDTIHENTTFDGVSLPDSHGRLWVNYNYKEKASAYLHQKLSEQDYGSF